MSEEAQTTPNLLKQPDALKVVKRYANWSLAPGLLPTPILDLGLLMGIQLRMIQQLSKLYDQPFSANSGKAIISSLMGAVVPAGVGFGFPGLAVKTIPVVGGILGMAFMPAFAWATTYALGKVFVQHLESGNTFLSFDPAQVRDYYRKEFEAAYAERTGKPAPAPATGKPATAAP